MNKNSVFLCLSAMLLFFSCDRNQIRGGTDGATFGDVKIAVDETLAPIIDSQLMVFHATYKDAHITPIMCSEAEAMNLLLKDSVRSIIVTRDITPQERAAFASQGYHHIKALHIATDGVAVIVNPNNRDTAITYEQLRDITTGKIADWSKVNGVHSGKIQIVFDNANSSTVRFVQDSINKGAALPSDHVFATKTNAEVIEHVAKTPNAIGFIGINWISDQKDDTHLSFLRKIRTVGITAEKGHTGYAVHWYPFQADIARKYYPLRRKVFSICREARMGLGSGFNAFLAGERGQRIFLKAGLVPATAPLRIVNTHK
jgi:phosphate transport system substrate-binding protein